jgi:hypothetical protein
MSRLTNLETHKYPSGIHHCSAQTGVSASCGGLATVCEKELIETASLSKIEINYDAINCFGSDKYSAIDLDENAAANCVDASRHNTFSAGGPACKT